MSAAPQTDAAVKRNYIGALNEALLEEMSRNPDLICMGEDIGLLGGAFGVTEGLMDKFGEARVLDTPISESLIVGAAIGAAMNGKSVVAEMQFIDFISCGFDQIVNNLATLHYRSAGEVEMPIVIRGPAGAYGGGALYHSQMNEAWFCHSPGLKVVCPSTPADAKGLMKSAIRDRNPVVFYEIKELYRKREIEEEVGGPDDLVPLGQAAVRRQGSDVTLVSYGQNVYHCLRAADELSQEGVSAEVIDLRSLVPLDEETVLASLSKTNRIVVVNEAPRTCGFAGEVMARVIESGFEYLDAPPQRVTRMDTPVPWVKPLETYVLPDVAKIVAAAQKVVRY